MSINHNSIKLLNRILVTIYRSSFQQQEHSGHDESWSYSISRVHVESGNMGLKHAELLNHQLSGEIVYLGSSYDSATDSRPDFIFYTPRDLGDVGSLDQFRELQTNGVGIILLPSLQSLRRINSKNHLSRLGLAIGSAIELPEKFLEPETSMRPILACLTKTQDFRRTTFFSCSSYEDTECLENIAASHRGEILQADDLKKYQSSGARDLTYLLNLSGIKFSEDDSLELGVTEILSCFPGFRSWRTFSALDNFVSELNSFPLMSIELLASSIRRLDKGSQPIHHPSAFFLHREWTKFSFQTLGQHPSSQIQELLIDQSKLDIKYLEFFLEGRWGKTLLKALRGAESILVKNPFDAERAEPSRLIYPLIPLPSLEEQRDIVEVSTKLKDAKSFLYALEDTLRLQPTSDITAASRQKLDHLLTTIEETSGEILNPLIAREESKTHEFKASIREPYPSFPEPEVENGQTVFKLGNKSFKSKKDVHKFMEMIILKSVAAFLNTNGGSLVIGVHEKDNRKTLVGIDYDGFISRDAYERHLLQILENEFSAQLVAANIELAFFVQNDLEICEVKVQSYTGPQPVFVGDSMYVRTGAMVKKLDGPGIAGWMGGRASR